MRDVEAGLYEPERKIRIVDQNDIQQDLEEMNKCIDMLIEPKVQSMKGLKPSLSLNCLRSSDKARAQNLLGEI